MSLVPKRIRVGPYRYRVTVSTERIDAESVSSGSGMPGSMAGRHMPENGEILLADFKSADFLAETLLHETIHAALHAAGADLDGDTEERVCLHLSPVLLDTLRRSPKLVAFLMDPEVAL